MKISIIGVIGILLLANSSHCQKLALGELLTVYTADSNSLKSFSAERQFVLTSIKEDNRIFSYTYQSSLDKGISFIRTFSKNTPHQAFLYYYFDDKKDYKNFKEALKSNGFEKLRADDMYPNNPLMSVYREVYVKDDVEAALNTTNVGKSRRVLLLYNRVNY